MKLILLTASLSLFAFASCCKCKDDDVDTPKTEKTVVLQPGPSNANSVYVSYQSNDPGWANGNNNSNPITYPELPTCAWTTSGTSLARSFLAFKFDTVPANAEVVSAKLSLYGVPSSNVIVQGNNGVNTVLIQRVLENWNQATVTWNTQPAITTQDQVEIPATSTTWNHSVLDIDVTAMVKAMRSSTPEKTSGFCIRQKDESPSRSMLFASSKNPDASRRPKLVIVYKS